VSAQPDPTSPPHYSRFPIQPREFIEKNKLNWFEGNIVKYVLRAPYKGACLEDLKKARSNLDDLIRVEEERLAKDERDRELAEEEARFAKWHRDQLLKMLPRRRPLYFTHLYPS
jgi:hypothetical protein